MSASLIDTFDGIVTLELRGVLSPSEMNRVNDTAASYLHRRGGGKMLILAQEFEGWASQTDWSILTTQEQNDQLLKKMAIVADERWRSAALLFTANGIRPFPIEFFATGQEAEAHAWLNA
jgi:SpoIIAA-like